MRAGETSRTRAAPEVPIGGWVGLAALAAGAYAAHAGMADSPYWMAHGHWPWVLALRAAALAVDWPQGVKVMVILGSSLLVMRAPAPRPTRGFEAPRRREAAPAPLPFGLEAAR